MAANIQIVCIKTGCTNLYIAVMMSVAYPKLNPAHAYSIGYENIRKYEYGSIMRLPNNQLASSYIYLITSQTRFEKRYRKLCPTHFHKLYSLNIFAVFPYTYMHVWKGTISTLATTQQQYILNNTVGFSDCIIICGWNWSITAQPENTTILYTCVVSSCSTVGHWVGDVLTTAVSISILNQKETHKYVGRKVEVSHIEKE